VKRLILTALLLGGGSSVAAATPPQAPATPAAIVAYHDSGRWAADTSRVIRRARRHLTAHLSEPKPAIVLDVDDTSLSSYGCLKQVHFKRGKADCSGNGTMPAIKQTRSLYRYARSHHVTVFFITGRRAVMRETTIANLHRAGYAGRIRIKLRPDQEAPGTHNGWKARTRAQITARGFRIIANVGDQRSDLTGGHALRAFKLPNPMYVIRTA
jgi:putative acid phosphatase of HAD superfamily subfamily IIIB